VIILRAVAARVTGQRHGAQGGPRAGRERDALAVPGHCQRCSVLGAHPQLRLIRSATKFGGGLAVDHATSEEPLIPLLYVIRVRIRNVVIRNGLLRALRMNNRRWSGANQDDCEQSQERERAESGDEGHLPVSKAAEAEAIQKR